MVYLFYQQLQNLWSRNKVGSLFVHIFICQNVFEIKNNYLLLSWTVMDCNSSISLNLAKMSSLIYVLLTFECHWYSIFYVTQDTRVLNLTENPAFRDRAKKVDKGGYVDLRAVPFICPVIGIEMNGLYK